MKTGMKKNPSKPKAGKLPGVELKPISEEDGALGPYADSPLRSVTGTRRNPLAIEGWYNGQAKRLTSAEAPVITCAHPQLEMWLRVVGGMDPHWDIQQMPIADWPLSRIIPRISPAGSFPQWPIPKGTYWIDYPSVTSSLTKLPEKEWQLELGKAFPEGSTLLLGFIAAKQYRLNMWRMRFSIWNHPFFRQFTHIVCPDFSSYMNDPYPQALVGERLTQQWVQMGAREGYNMIPILSWQNRDSLRRQVDLMGALAEAGHVNTVYVEWLSRGVNRTDWLWSRLDDFEAHLAHLPVRWIFSGIDSGWFIRELRRVLPRENFHATTIWPWMRTGFAPGLKEQKAQHFRADVAKLEDLHRGDLLPQALPRPEDPLGALWSEILA